MVDWFPIIDGTNRGFGADLIRFALRTLTPFYASGVAVRNWLYDRNWLGRTRLSVPVVSVGNVTTGGSGKTPFVVWLARTFQVAGWSPGLLSRGYLSLDSHGNDEGRLLSRLCPGVPHVQQRDRVAGGQRAISELGCDVLVVDDGFQHRRLARDLDIVLLDAVVPWGYGALLPRGLMRESASSLRRADLVVLTRVNQVSEADVERLRKTLAGLTSAPVAGVSFEPTSLRDGVGGILPLERLQGCRVGAFCGIGNPTGFRLSMNDLCDASRGWVFRAFPDHHHYRVEDLAELAAWGTAEGVDLFLTTGKDMVKLPEGGIGGVPLLSVEIETRFAFGEDVVRERIDRLRTMRVIGSR
ncbi:MAG: tetraacyldisaccharide 4'-kinase [Planctomycetaceae bacterium]